jgi:NAD(P)-dependent dehydrogenase (short-subunit alcohol dehydrogenase family)
MKLRGKKALVTGAAQGIGRAIALRFVQEGASIACIDCAADALGATVRDLQSVGRERGAQVIAITADVGIAADVERSSRSALAQLQGLDILVNNAGVNAAGSVEAVSADAWNRVMAVNLTSMFLFTKAVWPVFSKQKHGAIVNMSSIMGLTGVRESFAYCASKAAIIGLTKSIAADGAPLGIRVNCICPGFVSTPIMDQAHSRQMQDRISVQIPARRMAAPAEIAAGCLYLVSDDASYASGSVLVLDGSATAGFAGCYLEQS